MHLFIILKPRGIIFAIDTLSIVIEYLISPSRKLEISIVIEKFYIFLLVEDYFFHSCDKNLIFTN